MNEFLLAALASPGVKPRTGRRQPLRETGRENASERVLGMGGGRAAKVATLQQADAPGKQATAKALILDGKAAEEDGRLEDALKAFQTALVILPGEMRLIKKVSRVEEKISRRKNDSQAARKAPRTPPRRAIPPPLQTSLADDPDLDSSADLLSRGIRHLNLSRARKAIQGGHPQPVEAVQSTSPPGPAQDGGEEEEGHGKHARQEAFARENGAGRMGDVPVREVPLSAGGAGGTRVRGEEEGEEGKGGGGVSDVERALAAVRVAATSQEMGQAAPEHLEGVNREMRNLLARQVVDVMNSANQEDLTWLHGIGVMRAQRIVAARDVSPFTCMEDLSRIGLFHKQIAKIAKQNVMERLEFPP